MEHDIEIIAEALVNEEGLFGMTPKATFDAVVADDEMFHEVFANIELRWGVEKANKLFFG